jgi:hypothetical protein
MYLKGQRLHWVKALGFSRHISWNVGQLDAEQIAQSFERRAVHDLLIFEG